MKRIAYYLATIVVVGIVAVIANSQGGPSGYMTPDLDIVTGVGNTTTNPIEIGGAVVNGSVYATGPVVVQGAIFASDTYFYSMDVGIGVNHCVFDTAGNMVCAGSATASYFFGDGSFLTGIMDVAATGTSADSWTIDNNNSAGLGLGILYGGATTGRYIVIATNPDDFNPGVDMHGGMIQLTDAFSQISAYNGGTAASSTLKLSAVGLDLTFGGVSSMEIDTAGMDVYGYASASAGFFTYNNATAAYFFGDGSFLTGITAVDNTRVLRSGDTMYGSLTAATSTISANTMQIGGGFGSTGCTIYSTGSISCNADLSTAGNVSASLDISGNSGSFDVVGANSYIETLGYASATAYWSGAAQGISVSRTVCTAWTGLNCTATGTVVITDGLITTWP